MILHGMKDLTVTQLAELRRIRLSLYRNSVAAFRRARSLHMRARKALKEVDEEISGRESNEGTAIR